MPKPATAPLWLNAEGRSYEVLFKKAGKKVLSNETLRKNPGKTELPDNGGDGGACRKCATHSRRRGS